MTRNFLNRSQVGLGLLSLGLFAMPASAGSPTNWSMNATGIEACSCPMFCQCYFNTQPAAHHEHGEGGKHFCKANAAYKVNKGNFGGTKLDGAKFWLYGDLGGDFSKGETDWGVITFDKATTPEQREAIKTILGFLMPVKWKSLTTSEGDIAWEASKDAAHATLDGGTTAEVSLKRFPGMTSDPVVMKNLPYWAAARNTGFVMMPNVVEALRKGDNAFEYKGTNGFMITFDINSKDVAKSGM